MSKPSDFKNLSREEKLALLDALEEKKRRRLSARSTFVPHEGQLPVCKSDKYIRCVISGNSFGKTALCVNEALWAVQGYNPIKDKHYFVPANVVVVVDKGDKADSVWVKELRKWCVLKADQLKKNGKPYTSQIEFPNGSTITFMSHEMDELAFESLSDISAVIMDEMPPRHIFVALTRGQRDKHLQPWVLMASTMIAASWIHQHLYVPWSRGEREDVEFFTGSMRQNEQNLADGYIARFSRNLTEKEKLVRIDGGWGDIDGYALAHLFKRDVHVVPRYDWPATWPTVCVVDPAMRKPHVAILCGVTPKDQLVYIKEMRLKAPAADFARALKDFYKGYRVTDIVVDSLGSSDLTGSDGLLSFIAVLNKHGVRARATSYNEKDNEAFVSMVQDVLAIPQEPDNFGQMKPRLQIMGGCPGIIADIESVAFMKVKNSELWKPVLDIAEKDYLACFKYFLASIPRFGKGREKVIRAGSPGLTGKNAFGRKSP